MQILLPSAKGTADQTICISSLPAFPREAALKAAFLRPHISIFFNLQVVV
jgi:hypothetical protein